MTNTCLRGAALALIIGLVGCNTSESKVQKPAPPKINLPNSPTDMSVKRISERFADGSYSVSGLIRSRNKLFGEFIEVKGFIQRIHRCTKDEICDTPPHAVLVDDLQRPRRRLVILGDDNSEFPSLQQGQAKLVRGLYRQTDPTGIFVRMEGIVVMSPKVSAGLIPEDADELAAPKPQGAETKGDQSSDDNPAD